MLGFKLQNKFIIPITSFNRITIPAVYANSDFTLGTGGAQVEQYNITTFHDRLRTYAYLYSNNLCIMYIIHGNIMILYYSLIFIHI